MPLRYSSWRYYLNFCRNLLYYSQLAEWHLTFYLWCLFRMPATEFVLPSLCYFSLLFLHLFFSVVMPCSYGSALNFEDESFLLTWPATVASAAAHRRWVTISSLSPHRCYLMMQTDVGHDKSSSFLPTSPSWFSNQLRLSSPLIVYSIVSHDAWKDFSIHLFPFSKVHFR